MSTATLSLFEQATQLSDAECEELYEQLGSHLYRQEAEEPLTSEMKSTLDRRWEEIVTGKVQCIPHSQVMSELRAKYGA